MTRFQSRRGGFTLVELLAVMAIMATLAAIAMLVAPGILAKDRSVDATTQVELWLQIARARAQHDRMPRGLRLIVDPTKPGDPLLVTEVQQIESPPVLVLNPNPPYPNGVGSPLNPYVEFRYTAVAGGPSGGTITGRECRLRGLDPAQRAGVIANAPRQPLLWMPVLGTWHRITAASISGSDVIIVLDGYPDAQLGVALEYRTYHFGIYNPPIPLLGEPTMQLPKGTCIDLNPGVSSPGGSTSNDYDILFAPNGQLAFTANTNPGATSIGGAGHVFLWVRDPDKAPSIVPTGGPSGPFTYNLASFQQGGEMMIVAIKAKSGSIGAGPVNWPDPPNFTTPVFDPYYLARKAVAGP